MYSMATKCLRLIERKTAREREREGGEGFYLHLKVVNPSFKTKLYF